MVGGGQRLGQQREHDDPAPSHGAFLTTAGVAEPRRDQDGSRLSAGKSAENVGQRLAGHGLHRDVRLGASSFFKHGLQASNALVRALRRLLQTLLHDRLIEAQEGYVVSEASTGESE